MNTGAVISSVQVTVRDAVDVLPQPSVAVKVLVCDLKHVPDTEPSPDVTVGTPHPSVADALPRAAVIALASGLHPNGTAVNELVNTGGVISTT